MITMTVSVRGWSNEPSPLLSTTEPSTGPTGPVEAWPAKVAVPSPPEIPPVALKISDSSGITHQTVYTSPGTRPDVWITQVITLLLRTSWAEPTLTGLVAMVLTEAKSWSAAFGSCALSKVATANNRPTETANTAPPRINRLDFFMEESPLGDAGCTGRRQCTNPHREVPVPLSTARIPRVWPGRYPRPIPLSRKFRWPSGQCSNLRS